MNLPLSAQSYDATNLKDSLHQELQKHAGDIVLQAMLYGTDLAETPWQIMVLKSQFSDQQVVAEIGVFFQSLNGGCNCSDNPDPLSPENEYGEFVLTIDRSTYDATLKQK